MLYMDLLAASFDWGSAGTNALTSNKERDWMTAETCSSPRRGRSKTTVGPGGTGATLTSFRSQRAKPVGEQAWEPQFVMHHVVSRYDENQSLLSKKNNKVQLLLVYKNWLQESDREQTPSDTMLLGNALSELLPYTRGFSIKVADELLLM